MNGTLKGQGSFCGLPTEPRRSVERKQVKHGDNTVERGEGGGGGRGEGKELIRGSQESIE